MGKLSKNIKRTGQVIITTAILGLFTVSSLGATGQALSNKIDTNDIISSISNTTEDVSSSFSDVFLNLLGVNTVNAANNSTNFKSLEVKIRSILNSKIYIPLEKRISDNKARSDYLLNFTSKIQSFKEKNTNKYNSNSTYKFIIDTLISKLQDKANFYLNLTKVTKETNSNSNSNSNSSTVSKSNTIKTSWTEEEIQHYKPSTNARGEAADIQRFKENPLSQKYAALGGVRLDIGTLTEKDRPAIDKANSIISDLFKRDNTRYIKRYIDYNLNENLLPFVVMSGKTIEEIQEITQKNNYYTGKGYVMPLFSGKIWVRSLKGGATAASAAFLGGDGFWYGDDEGRTLDDPIQFNVKRNPSFDMIKYAYVNNGTIKINSQKYKDFKRDFYIFFTEADKKNSSTVKGLDNMNIMSYNVKFEPLPYLSKDILSKIRNEYKFSSDELYDLWSTVLKKEGLDKWFEIVDEGYGYEVKSKRKVRGGAWSFSWHKDERTPIIHNSIMGLEHHLQFMEHPHNLTQFLFYR